MVKYCLSIVLVVSLVFLAGKNDATEAENSLKPLNKQWGSSCVAQPCYNGGVCVSTGPWSRYCICQKYFTGPSCTACK